MAASGIQGKLLEVTVVGCFKLKDTEWICRQDPYVCIEYSSTKFRTRTYTDGGKNPTFQEKFVFTLNEGIREIGVMVFNENTVTYDDFIGSGKIQLQKVLSTGFDDSLWPLHTKTGRHAGEVRVIMHYSLANKPATSRSPYGVPPVSHSPNPLYPYTPPSPAYAPPPPQAYPSPYPYQPQPPPGYPQAYPTPTPPQGVYPSAQYTHPPSTYRPSPFPSPSDPPPSPSPSYGHYGTYSPPYY